MTPEEFYGEPRIKKLPKWAQSLIRTQRANLREYETAMCQMLYNQLVEADPDQPRPRVTLEGFPKHNETQPLPSNARVRFHVGDEWVEVRFHNGPGVHVWASDRLLIEPVFANVATLMPIQP